MAKNYMFRHDMECPKSFVRYKNDCYYHSYAKGDYNTTELLCAEKSSKVIMIKDRATYQFIRSWAIANGFHNFYLGYNYTTGDPATPPSPPQSLQHTQIPPNTPRKTDLKT